MGSGREDELALTGIKCYDEIIIIKRAWYWCRDKSAKKMEEKGAAVKDIGI